MMPFDQYPGGGSELIGKCGGANCRHECGLKLRRLTGQTSCAYRGLNLVDTYENWLLMLVDYVVPTKTDLAMGIEKDWLQDCCNTVLCCAGSNGFGNRFKALTVLIDIPGFNALHDARSAAGGKERDFYNTSPWERRLVLGGVR